MRPGDTWFNGPGMEGQLMVDEPANRSLLRLPGDAGSDSTLPGIREASVISVTIRRQQKRCLGLLRLLLRSLACSSGCGHWFWGNPASSKDSGSLTSPGGRGHVEQIVSGGAPCSPLWQDIRPGVKAFLPPDHPSFKGRHSAP